MRINSRVASLAGRRLSGIKAGFLILVAVSAWYAPIANGASSSATTRLAHGRVGRYHWRVDAYRRSSAHVPCLQIELHRSGKPEPLEPQVGEVSCRPVSPFPNAFGVVDELSHPNVTVIAFGLATQDRSIALYFHGSARDRVVPAKLLSPFKIRKTGLRPFRYVALAFKGRSCLSRFVIRDKFGDVAFDGGPMRCWR